MSYISTITGKKVNLLSMSRLSAYTIAANCSDVRDVKDGLDEVYDFIDRLNKADKKVPITVIRRCNKLNDKLSNLQNN